MLEPLVRSSLPCLQGVYDRCPSAARNLLTSARGWVLTRLRYSQETFRLLGELRADESWTPGQIYLFQLCALQQLIDHALRTVPFYSRYPRREIESIEDLRRFPVLDRDTALRNQERLLSQAVPPRQRIRASTTGTTGTSLRIAYPEKLVCENWAFLLRQWAWAGVEPRHPRITLQGSRIVPVRRAAPPYWTYNVPERQILLSIFHLSDKTAAAYLDFLQRHAGCVIESFPSVLLILADFALDRGERIPMRAVFTSGEPLYPEACARIRQAFSAPVFDTYGMTEYCGLIQQCEQGGMHLAPEYGYLEILDEHGDAVAAGKEGDFVWTGFLNEAMPLIRYRIGDRGRWSAGTCSCGRAFPLVMPTITRESDLLRCPDGRLFSPRALNQLLKAPVSLRFCQFVHDRPNRVAVRAVVRSANEKEQAIDEIMRLRSSLQDLVGSAMQVTAQLAAAPIVRPGGKIPLILSQVEQP